jgi:putative oxidoreductase
LNPLDYLNIKYLEVEVNMATTALTRPVPNRSVVNIALWALQLVTAYEFLRAGSAKLMSAPMMIQVFAAVGFGQWFRYFTGAVEVVCAIGLLIPLTSGYAAAVLSAVMVGAVATHVFVLGITPALPLSLLAATLLIAWGRLWRKI